MEYIGHTGSARELVLRMTNVHYLADPNIIRNYFNRYAIIDQIRAPNPRTRTLSVVYVMFERVEERNHAYINLNHGKILDRRINLMPAHTGNYESRIYVVLPSTFTDNAI